LANPRLEWLLNVRAEQYIGQHYTTIIGSLEQTEITTEPIFSLPSVMDVIAQIDDNPYEITRRTYLLQEPALRSIEEISSPVSNSDNQLIGRIFVLRDTTNAFELERYREELSGMLVHDLRSPLGAVIAGLHMAIEEMELGRDQADEALIMTTMRVALNSANRLLNMVTNLLDIYKLEAGELRLKTEPLKLADIAAHAVDILRSVALEAGVHVGVKAPNNLSRVIADVQIIERVLINLLDNALRYTPAQGYVTVQVRRQGDQQIVSVLDSGSGIPPESRADVFKRHVQLQTGRRVRGAKGSGLGLTFCKLAVESHGGKIWVDDGPEGGAAFHFSLPIKGPSSARHPESLSA
jgi:signal transduction histidine kinase